MTNKKKLKDYFNLGMRKLKHRKGFGVHSPFAFSIITQVIEEKLPYYAYHRMQTLYRKQAPVSFKVACLLFRLANRFKCRTIAELGCDGGYTMLPLLLSDSRNHISTQAPDQIQHEITSRLSLFKISAERIAFTEDISMIEPADKYDMIVINQNPFAPDKPNNNLDVEAEMLVQWVMTHTKEDSLVFVNGIQPRQKLEQFWDLLCDRDDVSITMDLYNNGLAILKPRFFKQHYIAAF